MNAFEAVLRSIVVLLAYRNVGRFLRERMKNAVEVVFRSIIVLAHRNVGRFLRERMKNAFEVRVSISSSTSAQKMLVGFCANE